MKNIKVKILIFSLLGVMGSCSDKLDFDPYNTTPPVQFWTSEADANAAIAACYGKIVDWGFNDPATFALNEIASGNTKKGGTASDQPKVHQFSSFTFTATHEHIAENWNMRYVLINICNQAITNIPKISMDEATKKSLIGEAKFIHAWAYFDLVKTFGEVPLYDGLPTDGNYNVSKSSLADVYKVIENDLLYASQNCKTTPWSADMKGRVTAWHAKAYLAKVKMYEASGANFTDDSKAVNDVKWSDVKSITDDVISNGPFKLFTERGDSSFFYLFRLENENCDESIFEAQCGTSKTVGGIARSSFAQYQWAPNLNGWAFNAPSDEIINDWMARTDDTIRFKQSIAFQGLRLTSGDVIGEAVQSGTSSFGDINATGIARSRFNFKAYESRADDQHNGGWQAYCEQNYRLYRYAEVLLIDAEAEFRLGNLQEAVNSINLVRNRVKETPLTIANITLQKILDERRFELAFENDYFFDLVRSGRAEAVLGSAGFKKQKNYFYPIPQLQIDLSKGVLKQNKYWE
ncbi:MAG: RagB/SusD family nutrient uptake outer membrane protein [Bacteroidales bacterium]|nr:RagB/SusD family nutrient uptake outer membrane protein [Bacteroidales bacterium]